MLGKLIKNDMKSAARGVSNIYVAAFIVIATMGISLFADLGIGKVVSSVALIGVSIAAIIVTVMTTFGDFKKTMYGDRGYLTHTLPVKGPLTLLSKWITSMVWITLSYLIVFLCMGLVYYYWTGEDSSSAMSMFLQMLPEVGLPTEDILMKTLIFIAIKGIILLSVFVMEVFLAVTLTNIRGFDRLGSVGGILYFFVIYGILTFCSSKLEDIFTSALIINSEGAISFSTNLSVIDSVRYSGGAAVTLTQIYFQVIVAVLLFVLTAELVDKKINVK